MLKKLLLPTLLTGAALAFSMPTHALTIVGNPNIAAARTAFGGAPTHNWDASGAPGGVVAAAGSSLAIGEWITSTGFEGNDLAISGNESFTLSFAAPVKRIGFAVSTGTGLFPSEVRNTGAVFNIATNTGDSGVLTLSAMPMGFTVWIEMSSTTAFSSIRFTDTTDIWDQYFGDVYAVSAAAVPEPSTWTMMIAGFGAVGFAARRRRSIARVA